MSDIEGLRLNSDVAPAGSFACSNEQFNRIQQMVLWTELSNLFSVESDCPHREKFGYGGDIVAASEMAMFNFDMARFYAKAVHDLADAVRPNGGFTETAPFVGISDEGLGGGSGPGRLGHRPAVPAVASFINTTATRRLLASNTSDQALDRVAANLRAGRSLDNGISDHESLAAEAARTDGHRVLLSECQAVREYRAGAGPRRRCGGGRRIGGKNQDGIQPANFSNRIWASMTLEHKPARHSRFTWGWRPDDEAARALDVLTHNVSDAHQGHLTTGIFGTKFMLNVAGRCRPG